MNGFDQGREENESESSPGKLRHNEAVSHSFPKLSGTSEYLFEADADLLTVRFFMDQDSLSWAAHSRSMNLRRELLSRH